MSACAASGISENPGTAWSMKAGSARAARTGQRQNARQCGEPGGPPAGRKGEPGDPRDIGESQERAHGRRLRQGEGEQGKADGGDQRPEQPDGRADGGLLVALVEGVVPARPPAAQPEEREGQRPERKAERGAEPDPDILGQPPEHPCDAPAARHAQDPSGCRSAADAAPHPAAEPAKHDDGGQGCHAEQRAEDEVAQRSDNRKQTARDNPGGGGHSMISASTSPSARSAARPISAAMVGAMADWSTAGRSPRRARSRGPR